MGVRPWEELVEVQSINGAMNCKVQGEYGPKTLRINPVELGDYIDGDDGHQANRYTQIHEIQERRNGTKI